MDMNNNLLHDEFTNVVYFSSWLNDTKEGHPEFYQRLLVLLKEIGIEVKELKSTKDYWARDYMPIQLGENEFLKYRYYPDYLVESKDKEDIETITELGSNDDTSIHVKKPFAKITKKFL